MSRALNGKLMGMIVAGALAAGGGTVAYINNQPKPEAPRAATYQPRTADQRHWGGLSGDELNSLNLSLRSITPSKVDILCAGNFCRELQEDLDEAFESAGFDAYMPVTMFDTGKGMAISPDNARTQSISAAIAQATGGRIKFEVIVPLGQDGKPLAPADDTVTIVIARKKPN